MEPTPEEQWAKFVAEAPDEEKAAFLELTGDIPADAVPRIFVLFSKYRGEKRMRVLDGAARIVRAMKCEDKDGPA